MEIETDIPAYDRLKQCLSGRYPEISVKLLSEYIRSELRINELLLVDSKG